MRTDRALRRTCRASANQFERRHSSTGKPVPIVARQLRDRLLTLPRAKTKRPHRRRARNRSPFQRAFWHSGLLEIFGGPTLGRKTKLRARLERLAKVSRRRVGEIDRHLFGDGGLGGGEASDWNSERTATDVIEPKAMTEFYAVGFAAVFTADSELDLRSRFASEIASHFH